MSADLYNDFRRLIIKHGRITDSQFERIIKIVEDHKRWNKLKSSGPCLFCDNQIEYGEPCRTHKSKGDEWLENNLFGHFRSLDVANVDGYMIGKTSDKSYGYNYETIKPYLCVRCDEKLNEIIENSIVNKKKQRELYSAIDSSSQKKAYLSQDEVDDILAGRVKVSPYRRFKVLSMTFNTEQGDALKRMPYNEFIQTVYWDIVRKYVYAKYKYRCGLCNAADVVLHAHHKSYENRGYEVIFIDDLIALCKSCHEKYHEVDNE